MSVRCALRSSRPFVAIFWILPSSPFKIRVAQWLGYDVARDSTIGSCLVVGSPTISVASGATIRTGNVFRGVQSLCVGEGAIIGGFNFISAAPQFHRKFPEGPYGKLVVRPYGKISSRHTIDVSADVTIGAYASLAGHRTTILTHSTDIEHNAQVARPVVIGDRSFIGTNCLILGGAIIPPLSLVAAGALFVQSRRSGEPAAGLWAGIPARRHGDAVGEWFERADTRTTSIYDPSSNQTAHDAI